MRKICWVLSLLMMYCGSVASAAKETEGEAGAIGPYKDLTWDREYVQDVRVDDEQRIFLKLNPAHKDKDLVIRLSNRFRDGYRPWEDGKMEFVAPADRGIAAGAFADWIRTKANFVEYWIDGKLVLHLQRRDSQ